MNLTNKVIKMKKIKIKVKVINNDNTLLLKETKDERIVRLHNQRKLHTSIIGKTKYSRKVKHKKSFVEESF